MRLQVVEVPPFGPEAVALLENLATNFSLEDALAVKKVRPELTHRPNSIQISPKYVSLACLWRYTLRS